MPTTSLVGGTVEAIAQKSGAATIAANAVTIVDATTVRVTFNEDVLSEGVYTLQVRATVSGVTQTVAEAVVTVRGGHSAVKGLRWRQASDERCRGGF